MRTTSRRLALLGAITLLLALSVTIWSLLMLRQLGAQIDAADDAVDLELTQRDNLLAVVDEESGVRAYVATGDAAFLDIYRKGQRAFAEALETKGPQPRGVPIASDVTPLRAAGDDLQLYFSNEIALVAAGRRVSATQNLIWGKVLLDRYRLLDAGLQRSILKLSDQRTAAARSTLRRTLLVVVLALTVFAALGLAFFPLVRKGAGFERDALNDSVTALGNRRAFLTRLAELTRESRPFAAVLIDLDDFKAINDTYGHAMGDRVLYLTGERLRARLRPEDFPARIGGDEFAVLLDVESRSAAEQIVGRLCATIEHPGIDVGGTVVRVAASAGVCLYPADARDGAALLAAADREMYANKRLRKRLLHAPSARQRELAKR